MTSRLALGIALLLTVAACDKTSAGSAGPPSGAGGSDPGSEEVCASDNCIVPVSNIEGVCAPTLQAATKDCPGVVVNQGPCGEITHITITTPGPTQDCYYDTASGNLIGGIVRSDAGFTKIAGTIPVLGCAPTTQVCTGTIP
jgi:hypothetical protein